MKEKIAVYIPQEKVEARIQEIADQINKEFAGESVHLICILKGSVMFTTELAKRLTIRVTMDFMSCSSYGDGTVSSGIVRLIKDLDEPIEGKNVIIIEDIIDSGNTLAYLKNLLLGRKPKTLKIATLLNKPSRRVRADVQYDYCCFDVEDKFIVGYGLDYHQGYRNLPYVGILEFED